MGLSALVLRNQLYYRKKAVPAMLLCGLLLLTTMATYLLVRHITGLADKPLASLETELILQMDSGNKKASGVKTRGLLEPFNLHSFDRRNASQTLSALTGVKEYSTALVLWQFDPKNTLTVVGLNPADPKVGLRKIENLLMKGGRFFSGAHADEIIFERHFAALYRHKVGDRFRLADRDLLVVGLVDFTEQSNLTNASGFLPYETALDLSRQNTQVINQIFVSLFSSSDIREVSGAVGKAFPGFSLISKDSLYKNLSALNQLIYRGGNLLVILICPIALLLMSGVLKVYRLEFVPQMEILKALGWSKGDMRRWVMLDLFCLLGGSIFLAGLLTLAVYWLILPQLQIAPLLNQGFQL